MAGELSLRSAGAAVANRSYGVLTKHAHDAVSISRRKARENNGLILVNTSTGGTVAFDAPTEECQAKTFWLLFTLSA